jgi:pimeloyl-ACP methyl ester carboxylesterase
MPILTVDDAGKSLYYLDSGPVPNETYVTIFILHGYAFHSPVFKRLFPLAATYNLRIVAISRRGYPGSTPRSPIELDIIARGDANIKIQVLGDGAREIAVFMDKFIQEQAIPRPSADGRTGGVALCGWSLGNVQGLAFMALGHDDPPGVVERLEPYLKTYIIYGNIFCFVHRWLVKGISMQMLLLDMLSPQCCISPSLIPPSPPPNGVLAL